LIAYPAKYRSSGVMTFIVSEDGVVYEKDLGAKYLDNRIEFKGTQARFKLARCRMSSRESFNLRIGRSASFKSRPGAK
jgi:hypothetical protein